MGQALNDMFMPSQSERVPFDVNSSNGLIKFNDQYIPPELFHYLLLHYVDFKTLLSVQLVCKEWRLLLKEYVWRKKAEMAIKHPLPVDENAPWTMYYKICEKKPFFRNLVKNHSGQDLFTHWEKLSNGGDGWAIESPPAGAPPLPNDPVFEGRSECFVTSYTAAYKQQFINLISEEGCTDYLMNCVKPVIKFSEWYSCRWDCPAVYISKVSLIGGTSPEEYEIDSKKVTVHLKDDKQNQWFKFQHEFRDYAEGVTKIRIEHGGKDLKFWAGHYGCKVAGSCVTLELS